MFLSSRLPDTLVSGGSVLEELHEHDVHTKSMNATTVPDSLENNFMIVTIAYKLLFHKC